MNISVFGGSQSKPGSISYHFAYKMGKVLGESGHTILTGGYIGTMEAVSHGAVEAGGHVIGVTCSEIERWRPVKPNQWVQEEHRFETLLDRLNELIHACDAAIALPGGPGTLAEVSLMWNLMVIQASPKKPLILFGNGWKNAIRTLFRTFDDFIPQKQRSFLMFASSIEEVIPLLEFSNQ